MSGLHVVFEPLSKRDRLDKSLKISITSLSSGGKHPLSDVTEEHISIENAEHGDVEARIIGDKIFVQLHVDSSHGNDLDITHIVISWKSSHICSVSLFPFTSRILPLLSSCFSV